MVFVVDQRRRYDLSREPIRLQNLNPHPLSPSFRRQQDLPLSHLVNDVLRGRLPLRKPLDANLRLLAAFEILASGHPGPLHRLHQGGSRLRGYERGVRPHHLHLTAPDRLATEPYTKRKSRCIDNIHERCRVR